MANWENVARRDLDSAVKRDRVLGLPSPSMSDKEGDSERDREGDEERDRERQR